MVAAHSNLVAVLVHKELAAHKGLAELVGTEVDSTVGPRRHHRGTDRVFGCRAGMDMRDCCSRNLLASL